MSDAVVVPSAPALLPSYAGMVDPLAEVRGLCLAAVAGLIEDHPDQVLVLGSGPDPLSVAHGVTEPLSLRVGTSLLAAAGFAGALEEVVQPGPLPQTTTAGLLVVADGSACRGQKAPGHVDERAFAFDELVGDALAAADTAALSGLDETLAADLLAGGVPPLKALAQIWKHEQTMAEVDWSGDPFGVQYWVVRWSGGDVR